MDVLKFAIISHIALGWNAGLPICCTHAGLVPRHLHRTCTGIQPARVSSARSLIMNTNKTEMVYTRTRENLHPSRRDHCAAGKFTSEAISGSAIISLEISIIGMYIYYGAPYHKYAVASLSSGVLMRC